MEATKYAAFVTPSRSSDRLKGLVRTISPVFRVVRAELAAQSGSANTVYLDARANGEGRRDQTSLSDGRWRTVLVESDRENDGCVGRVQKLLVKVVHPLVIARDAGLNHAADDLDQCQMEMRRYAGERVHLAQQGSPSDDLRAGGDTSGHIGDVGVEAAHQAVWGPHEELGPVLLAFVAGRNVQFGNVGIEGSTDFRTHAGAYVHSKPIIPLCCWVSQMVSLTGAAPSAFESGGQGAGGQGAGHVDGESGHLLFSGQVLLVAHALVSVRPEWCPVPVLHGLTAQCVGPSGVAQVKFASCRICRGFSKRFDRCSLGTVTAAECGI